MSASQKLEHYKGRDMSEKLFRTDKTFIGSNSMRSHSEETLSARVFVEFIALIIGNRIYNLLKETFSGSILGRIICLSQQPCGYWKKSRWSARVTGNTGWTMVSAVIYNITETAKLNA